MNKKIVFVHGMFQNPLSWIKWIEFFEAKGYECIAPAWPYHEGEPSTLRSHIPEGLGDLVLDDIITPLETMILKMSEKPIVIGHSVGGLIAQLLLSKKHGKYGNRNQFCSAKCKDLIEKEHKAYTDENSITDIKKVAGRSHYICNEPGWKEVASFVEDWINKQQNSIAQQVL